MIKDISRTELWLRIKTGFYALVAIMMAGWLTDALNEDLMFRIITRYFFPNEVAKYEHPFTDMPSLFIWGIPIIIGFFLMLLSIIMTLHHLKKRRLYIVSKAKKLKSIQSVILCPPEHSFDDALKAYETAEHIHLIHTGPPQEEVQERIKKVRPEKRVTIHKLTTVHDLHSITSQLAKLIHKLTDNNNQDLAFDVKYTIPVVSNAAMYCSLETNLTLTYPEDGHICEYETTCEVES